MLAGRADGSPSSPDQSFWPSTLVVSGTCLLVTALSVSVEETVVV